MSLPETWYIPVPVVLSEASFFWKNPHQKLDLERVYGKLASLFRLDRDQGQLFGFETCLPTKSFYDKDDWDRFMGSVVFLKTDRFFDAYSPDLGSGRNVIFEDACWKGVGRNFAATRTDFSHTSGQLDVPDSLREIVIDRKLSGAANDIRVPLWGAGVYQKRGSAFIIRSASAIRCSQVPGHMEKAEKDVFLNYLKQSLPGLSENDWFVFLIRRLTRHLAHGIYSISATKDNITLDGRLLDNQSIEWVQFSHRAFLNAEFFFKDELVERSQGDAELFLSRVDVDDISNISTQVKSIQHCHMAIAAAFRALGLPWTEWGDLVPELARMLDMPEFLFTLEKNVIGEKLDYIKSFVRQASLVDPLEIEMYGARKVVFNTGRRLNKDIYRIGAKLCAVAMSSGSQVTSEDFSQILQLILLKYELEDL